MTKEQKIYLDKIVADYPPITIWSDLDPIIDKITAKFHTTSLKKEVEKYLNNKFFSKLIINNKTI